MKNLGYGEVDIDIGGAPDGGSKVCTSESLRDRGSGASPYLFKYSNKRY
jgi:hypothetical protein